jgi:hypothetical protein
MSRSGLRWGRAPSKVLAIAIAAALACGTAGAQTQSTTPTTDPGTKLAFPASLGSATFERSVNYAGPPSNRPDLGSSYFYSTPKKMIITVQIFDGGRRVPAGSASPIVVSEFTSELDSVAQQIQGSGYTHFERPSVPSSCTYGSTTFRCITYSALSQANFRVFTKLLLTGYQNHFIKIRIDWSHGHQQTAADAEAALQAFIPALLR